MKSIHLTKCMLLFATIFSFNNSADAETINLNGHVYDETTPIEGVKLYLKYANLYTYTNAAGYFEFYDEDPSSLTEKPGSEIQVHFDGNTLILYCQNQNVEIDVFDLKGNYISCLIRQNNLSGSYAIYPKAYLYDLVNSIYVVRVTINNRVFGYKVANNGDCNFSKGLFYEGTMDFSGNENEKLAGTIDSLIITHNSHITKRIAINSYIADMGTIQMETPHVIPGRIEAEDYSAMLGIQTESCSEGGEDVGYIDEGDWMNYVVNVSASGEYDIRCRVAAEDTGPHSFQIQTNGSTVTVDFSGTGGWQTWKDANEKISMNAGVQTIRISATSSAFNINYLEFTPSSADPVPFLSGPSTTTSSFDLIWTYNWTGSTGSDDHYELEYSYSENSGYQTFHVYQNAMRISPYTQNVCPEAVDIGRTTYFRVRVKSNGNYSGYSNVVGVYCPNLELTVFATSDNTLGYSTDDPNVANMNYWDDNLGVGANYNDGVYWDSWLNWSSAIYFDLMNRIEGRDIERAILKLSVEMLPGDWNTQYKVNPFTNGWNTYTITMSNAPSYYTGFYVLKDPPVTSVIPYEIDITNIVQAWANGTINNNGILIHDNNVSFPYYTAYRTTIFCSLETAILDEYKPQLELIVN